MRRHTTSSEVISRGCGVVSTPPLAVPPVRRGSSQSLFPIPPPFSPKQSTSSPPSISPVSRRSTTPPTEPVRRENCLTRALLLTQESKLEAPHRELQAGSCRHYLTLMSSPPRVSCRREPFQNVVSHSSVSLAAVEPLRHASNQRATIEHREHRRHR
jgi:hypothetical protein